MGLASKDAAGEGGLGGLQHSSLGDPDCMRFSMLTPAGVGVEKRRVGADLGGEERVRGGWSSRRGGGQGRGSRSSRCTEAVSIGKKKQCGRLGWHQ